MYQIYENGVLVGTTESITHIKYNTNNRSYNLCESNEAQGFVCKLPREVEVETEGGNTETVTTVMDCVFVLQGKQMKGTEPIGRAVDVEEPEELSYTEAQLSAMTNEELRAILNELGISGSMTKNNMISLILDKQRGV